MSIAIVLVGGALRAGVSYPLALVVGGCVLGFIPGLTQVYFDPILVLIFVLPPILYYAAYSIQFKEFQRNIKDILWLGLGLVVVVTLAIGLFFKWLFPDIPWAMAFAFGAIVSPPDAIAATTVLKKFAISSRLLSVLEGESLINDAIGLVLYRLAIVALLSGTFSLIDAQIDFAKIVVGGVLIGSICGYALHSFSRRFFDPILSVVFSYLIPYLTFFLADMLNVSGILAVVICGLIGSRMLVSNFEALTRVIGWASWDIVIILLNCFVFILIGLQLHGIIERLTIEKALLYTVYGFFLTVAMMVVRFIWVYIGIAIASFGTRKNHKFTKQIFRDAVIISWSGMRGIVSLTAALALPFALPDNTPLPGRDIVIFVTFVVILLTLLIPTLSLSPIMHYLHIHLANEEQDKRSIRRKLIKTAQEEIQSLYNNQQVDDTEYIFLLTYFNSRHHILEIASKGKKNSLALEAARLQVLRKKRACLLEMWEKNEISDSLFNAFERELDLEEAYIARAII